MTAAEQAFHPKRAAYTTWLEIDTSAITHNCRTIIAELGVALMAIVKAEAYGHGAVQAGEASLNGGASWLGVARYPEARSLRRAGITAPVLVLGMVMPEEVDEAIANQVTLTIHDQASLELLAARSRQAQTTLNVHLKVDTGLGRLGVLPGEALLAARAIQAEPWLGLDGLYSHLTNAEEPADPINRLQQERFAQAASSLQAVGMRPKWIHLANSAGGFYLPQARYDMARIGNVCLGLRIRVDTPLPDHYRPALRWKAHLAACRQLPAGWGVGYGQTYHTSGDELIGVVPAGFGDGLRRVPGNQVLIGGRRAPVVGRLSLDQMMVRLPQAFRPGEEVVIIGEQGDKSIWVHDLARLYQISQVDFTSLIHARVPRIYSEGKSVEIYDSHDQIIRDK